MHVGKPEFSEEEKQSSLQFMVDDIAVLQLVIQREMPELQGRIHSCASLDINNNLFLAD